LHFSRAIIHDDDAQESEMFRTGVDRLRSAPDAADVFNALSTLPTLIFRWYVCLQSTVSAMSKLFGMPLAIILCFALGLILS
jgi:hypothetical protein